MEVKKALLKQIQSVLIHCVGDTHICPKCDKGIVLGGSRCNQDAHHMFKKIKRLVKK